jgi:hypothetical protein
MMVLASISPDLTRCSPSLSSVSSRAGQDASGLLLGHQAAVHQCWEAKMMRRSGGPCP